MSKLSYKTLFIIVFFLLITIIILSKFVLPKNKVSAAWWNDGWNYRKAISVSNTSGSNLTDFQVSLSIGTSTLIASGKMQSDCDDMRFVDTNGNILPYWIESGCNTDTTTIWVKTTSLPNSGSTIYLYYGNSSATISSNWDSIITPTTVVSNLLTSGGNGQNLTWNNVQLRGKVLVFGSLERAGGCGGTTRYDEVVITGVGSSWYATDSSSCESADGYISGSSRQLIQSTISFTAGNYSVNWYTDGSAVSDGKDKTSTNQGNYDGKGGIELIQFFKYASTEPTSAIQSEEAGGGPIAYWKFDEGSGTTTYDSANQHTAILSGGILPTWQNEDQCISGKCLFFEGTSAYVNAGTSPDLTPQNITLEAWVKPTSFTNGWNGVITNMTSWGTGFGLQTGTNQKFAAMISGSYLTTSWTPSINTWYHVAATHNATTNLNVLYVNGVAQNSSTQSISYEANPKTYIGAFYTTPSLRFYGYIDDVKIYNYARTANQIKQDYNSRGSLSGSSVNLGVKSSTAPDLNSKLVAYYKFDEGHGNIIYNSASSSYDGTKYNTTTWSNDGKSNNSLLFDGTTAQIVSSNTSGWRNNGNDMSLSIWLKPDPSDDGGWVFSKPWNGSGNYNYYLTSSGGSTPSFNFRLAGASSFVLSSNKTISSNQWHQISIVVNNVTKLVKFYIDGQITNEGTHTIINWTPSGGDGNYNFVLGCIFPYANNSCAGSTSYDFKGYMDDFKYYNAALTDDEIKQDYNQGSAIYFSSTSQTIGGITTSLNYCIPGDTTYCASPVAEYNFEENTGNVTNDTSGNNNNGTFGTGNSAPTWTIGTNNKGSGLSLDGSNDYVSIPTYTYTSNATISVWIKGDYSNGNQIIIGSPNSISLGLYNIGSTKALIGFAGSSKDVGIASNFINNSWNHLAVVLDSSGNATYYCNGQLLTNNGTNNWTWSSNAYIGRRDSGTFLKGQIDDIKIYNYARTPAQIAYDYNKGGPIGWWKLDECQGSIAYDSSGIGNTGAISIGLSGSQNSLGTCQIGTSAAWTNGASGHTNSSLNFDGTDDYINVGDPSNGSLDFGTNDFSTSAWFKTSSSQQGVILGKYSGYPLFYTRLNIDGKIESRIGFDVSTNYTSTDGITVNNNSWHQIIVVYKRNGNMTRYLDGKIYGSPLSIAASSNVSINTANNFIVGAGSGPSQLFQGQIDDIRIYNYALTSTQIQTLYNNGSVSFN